MPSVKDKVRVGILGASGYTGVELLRILAHHPNVIIDVLTADRQAGKKIGAVFPHLARHVLPDLVAIPEVDWSKLNLVFCCLPRWRLARGHLRPCRYHLKVLDLSADFRLADPEVYAKWYGHAHRAVGLQREAVYGLTEVARAAIAKARLIAVPGCYPTGAQLPLIPLLKAELIDPDSIVIDAKSGVTGAGRAAKESSLFAEVSEGISAYAYGVAHHRHMPEIEQGLSLAAGQPVTISFTPHLMPMNRGILSTTIYVKMKGAATIDDLRHTLEETYAGESFVHVLPQGHYPATHHVRGSNLCLIGLGADRRPGHAILVSAIDNLVKGASGQAVQDMNVMLGLPETTGLQTEPLFP